MKKRELSHWERNQYTPGLLLFAEALEEGTFHYSYESYKIPALNCHYLCYDVLQTAEDINRKVLMDGNFIPLAEEFEQTLVEDLFIKYRIDDKGTLLFAKDKNFNFYDISKNELKAKINRYPEIANYVKDICEAGNAYLRTLLELIVDNIFSDEFSYENSAAIYNLTRMLLCDLVNSGYSKEYIYHSVKDHFFNSQKSVPCSVDTVVNFFNRFTFDEYDYRVVVGITRKASIVFNRLDAVHVRKPTPLERQQLKLNKYYNDVAEIELDSIDHYSVFTKARNYFNTVLALHQFSQHRSDFSITLNAIVSRKTEDAIYETGKLMQLPVSPMKKEGDTSYLEAIFHDISLIERIDPPTSFYRAIALHSGALQSNDISNQLLNLWTIVEVLIDTKRDNEDKINTICEILCSVLNRCYLYSSVEQLLHDIRECTSSEMNTILSGISSDSNDADDVEKFALLLALDKYKDIREQLLFSLKDYPLLSFRIQQYSDYIFADSDSIYNYLQRHTRRLRWHIMRIYRNRNMIVHSGVYMPYRNLIVENLHYYVDVLISTLVEHYYLGLLDHQSVYRHILNEEASYYIKLGNQLDRKNKKKATVLTETNALDLIFNGYSGNQIKKTIDHVLMERKSDEAEQSASDIFPLSLPSSSEDVKVDV